LTGLDHGYFPRGASILREVHEQRAVGLFYGQRALLIGALDAINYLGTTTHTHQRQTPFRRLTHTALWFEAVMLGTRAQADTVLDAVAKMHARVNGQLSEPAGPHPAGTPYDAFDAPRMLWTIAVMMDSAVCFYELLIRRLSDREREALWQDYIRFGELFGMPRDAAPASYRSFRDYFDGRLRSDELYLTDEARYVGYCTAFEIPMGARARPFKPIHDLIQLGSLPARVRAEYGLPWTAAHAAGFRAAVISARAMHRGLPAFVARGSCREMFEDVMRTEARRIERGQPTPGIGPLGEYLGPPELTRWALERVREGSSSLLAA
jgi:uncharacterized protein (DUF2236 family)